MSLLKRKPRRTIPDDREFSSLKELNDWIDREIPAILAESKRKHNRWLVWFHFKYIFSSAWNTLVSLWRVLRS